MDPTGYRTNLLAKRQKLDQKIVMDPTGFEPMTSSLQTRRSTRLSYRPTTSCKQEAVSPSKKGFRAIKKGFRTQRPYWGGIEIWIKSNNLLTLYENMG